VTEVGHRPVAERIRTPHYANHDEHAGSKDFKVVRDAGESAGESAAGSVHNSQDQDMHERKTSWAIPIQTPGGADAQGFEEAAKNAKKRQLQCNAGRPPPPAPGDPKKDEVQGVFVVKRKKGSVSCPSRPVLPA